MRVLLLFAATCASARRLGLLRHEQHLHTSQLPDVIGDAADSLGGVADAVGGSPPECDCSCCRAQSPSEVVEGAPPFMCTVVLPGEDSRCQSTCVLGCGTVIQASETGEVELSRFCVTDCKPTKEEDLAPCRKLNPTERAERATESGNGDPNAYVAP
jgi:hypothetical protein